MTAFLNSTAFWPGVEWSWDVWLMNIVFTLLTVATFVMLVRPNVAREPSGFQKLTLLFLWVILVLHMVAMIW